MVCLQETKVAVFSVTMLNELVGPDFDYCVLPADGVAGGVFIGWHRALWRGSNLSVATFSATVLLAPVDGAGVATSWLTIVYGPTDPSLREGFLLELEGLAASCQGA